MNTALDFEEVIRQIDNRIDELEAQDDERKLGEEKEKSITESISELNSLIGLKEVKIEVNKLVNYLKFVKKLQNKINLDKINLNMIFKGNPGTGKTTVAKIMADILYNLGYLSNNLIIEATPQDFIAGYIGQTAIKTRKLLDKYQGGLIFVDEAYGFNHNADEDNFADEALAEIMKEMESKNTVFIFAGYSKEMEAFVNLNPGIKSRIGYDIEFADYTEAELMEIFMKKLEKDGFTVSTDALQAIRNFFGNKREEKNFGNGRMIDNLYNKLLIEHATITYEEEEMTKLLTITEEAVMNLNLKPQSRKYFE